ncbi:MAG: hypothetical protein ACRDP3_24350 [Streptomyces sp.]|uniref:hypothetical protein n=1 Tax=Streptomyces sp. TaxID=1931 RepID=UPI003D6BB775
MTADGAVLVDESTGAVSAVGPAAELDADIAPRAPRQRCATAAKLLTKARARRLITALVGHD